MRHWISCHLRVVAAILKIVRNEGKRLCFLFLLNLFIWSHVTCYVSGVTCHVSCVTCKVSNVVCHLSFVTCHLSPVTIHLSLTPTPTPTDPPPANSPTMHSRVVHKNNNKQTHKKIKHTKIPLGSKVHTLNVNWNGILPRSVPKKTLSRGGGVMFFFLLFIA